MGHKVKDISVSSNHKNIMVAHSFFLKNDRKQHDEKQKPYPALATLYAAALLREKGHEISFFDPLLCVGLNHFFTAFEVNQPDILILYEDDFNFLTKMCLSHVREAAIEMIAFAKQSGAKVLVHSSDATDNPDSYLTAGADFVIAGEGEETLLELIDWLSLPTQQVISCPSGVIYQQNGRLVRTAPRPTMRRLDHLPQPAWDLIDFAPYQAVWQRYHGHYSVNMVTTRGCPYKCNWCAKPIWGQQYVSHSPAYIVDQLEGLITLAQPDHIWFADDIFGLNKGWLGEFANLIKSRNINIAYTTQTRADLVTVEFAAALKVSGCQQVWLGVESGSQAILDDMDKGVHLEQIARARALLKEQNIHVGFFIQLGYLGEDVEQLNETRNLILNLKPEEIGVSVSYPLPGTKFYDRVKAVLLDKTNWRESSDLDPTFASTFTADFYQKIRNYLHHELKHMNAGIEDSYSARKWDELMATSDRYRTAAFVNIEVPAE